MVLEGLVAQPFVTPEEFERVQVRRGKNRSYGGRKTRSYLLSGYIRCGVCGTRYSGTTLQGRRFPYGYRCGSSVGPTGRPRCRERLIPGPWLGEATWSRITDFLEDPAAFLTAVATHEEKSEDTANSIRQTLAHLERQKDQYFSYKQRAYDGLVRGITDEATYHRVLAGYKAHEAWLREELDRQREDLRQVEQQVFHASSIQSLYPVLKERLERATEEDKRFLLVCLGARVVISPEGTTLELAVPNHVLQGAVGTKHGFPARGLRGSPLIQRL